MLFFKHLECLKKLVFMISVSLSIMIRVLTQKGGGGGWWSPVASPLVLYLLGCFQTFKG